MFCRSFFISFIFLLTSFSSSSQWHQPHAIHLIAGLKSLGIDSVIHFSSFASGGIYSEDDMICEHPDYLFWKENGKFYTQKIRSCFYESEGYSTKYSCRVQIDSTTIYTFLENHFDSIFTSNLQPLVIKRIDGGIDYYEVPTLFHVTSHSFSIYIGDTLKTQEITMDCMRENLGYIQEYPYYWENLNYKYNVSTSLWKYFDLLIRKVEQLEEKKAYNFK